MKAMIFAAGLGSRLRPLTDTTPKPLIEIGGKPILRRVLENLIAAGVDEAVVNVHHLAPMIYKYLSDNNNFGITIHISDESRQLLDTGGGVLAAARWLDGNGPIVIHNADIATDLDLKAMVSNHSASGADVSLLVADRQSSRRLIFDRASPMPRMRGWADMATGVTRPAGLPLDGCLPLAFGGIHVIQPSILRHLAAYAPEAAFPIVPFYADSCHKLDIRGYIPAVTYRWYDIGRPSTLESARKAFTE